MRSLWLASAAFCLTAGVAIAQTTTTAPAPTGSPNAATSSPAPQASPGNMAPSSGSAASSGVTSGTMAPSSNGMASSSSGPINPSQSGGVMASPKAAATAPHYNGQGSISRPAGQANAMGSASGTTDSSRSAGLGMTHGTSGSGAMGMPENADPSTYLRIASKAIAQHNKATADDALSHAETRLLTRAVLASSGAKADGSPAVTAIEQARQALASGDYRTAASDTRMAMHTHHGMMGGSGMSGMSNMSGSDSMGNTGTGAMGGPAQ